MQTSTKRIGYYVEGRYYANRIAQAVARRDWLRSLYGRPVEIEFVSGVSTRMSPDALVSAPQ